MMSVRCIKIFRCLAIILLLLTVSCEPTPRSGENKTLEITSTVTPLRVQGSTWQQGDAIGVFCPTLDAENIQYTTEDNGTSAKFSSSSESIAIPFGDKTHALQAYYPYQSGIEKTYPIDITTLEHPLMWAGGSVKYSSPTVGLAFAYKVSQITIKIDASALTRKPSSAGSVRLVGVMTKGQMKISDGSLTNEPTTADLSLTNGTFDLNTHSWSATKYILVGQPLNDLTVKVTLDDLTYTATLPKGASTEHAVAGRNYKYTIRLTGDTSKVNLDGEGATIEGVSEEEIESTDARPTGEQKTPAPSSVIEISGVSGGAINLPTEGGRSSFTVSTTEDQQITATTEADWVTLSSTSLRSSTTHQGATTIIIETTANDTPQERSANITLTVGKESRTIRLIQPSRSISEPNPLGNGSGTAPYSVAKALEVSPSGKKGIWIQGYIVGTFWVDNSGKNYSLIREAPFASGVILLADTPGEQDLKKLIAIQLNSENKAINASLSLQSHPGNLDKKVAVEGTFSRYSSSIFLGLTLPTVYRLL